MDAPVESSSGDYRESHLDPGKPARYDPKFFEPGTTLNLFWEIEREILGQVVGGMQPRARRSLDFACGTGRVLSRMAELVPETVGVDVSVPMLARARERCPQSALIEADLTQGTEGVEGKFDVLTAFRFFLNAQPDLRSGVLRALRSLIDDRGRLIVNFHLNPRSVTGTYIRTLSRLRGRDQPLTMALEPARRLLFDHGFEVLDTRGYGYLLHRTDRVPFSAWGALERRLTAWNPNPDRALNFVLVARPRL
jgi:SAM-dependent methyltransferase